MKEVLTLWTLKKEASHPKCQFVSSKTSLNVLLLEFFIFLFIPGVPSVQFSVVYLWLYLWGKISNVINKNIKFSLTILQFFFVVHRLPACFKHAFYHNMPTFIFFSSIIINCWVFIPYCRLSLHELNKFVDIHWISTRRIATVGTLR